MTPEFSIELRGVDYCYDPEKPDRKALSDVSLSVAQGEFLGVIGHNGSGKSTLAKLLNGLLLPTAGQVLICGLDTRDEESVREIRKNVGMVFQNPDNQTVATIVEEDVAFGPENLGMPPADIRAAVDKALEDVALTELRAAKPHQLSGGQKQRLAIAGILAMRPRCIVFDESTAMLDPAGRSEVLSVMRTLNERDGVTVIHITHYMEELIGADRIAAMHNGEIAFVKTPRDAFMDLPALRAMRLGVPEIVELAEGLREGGLDIARGVMSPQALVEEICRLTSRI